MGWGEGGCTPQGCTPSRLSPAPTHAHTSPTQRLAAGSLRVRCELRLRISGTGRGGLAQQQQETQQHLGATAPTRPLWAHRPACRAGAPSKPASEALCSQQVSNSATVQQWTRFGWRAAALSVALEVSALRSSLRTSYAAAGTTRLRASSIGFTPARSRELRRLQVPSQPTGCSQHASSSRTYKVTQLLHTVSSPVQRATSTGPAEAL